MFSPQLRIYRSEGGEEPIRCGFPETCQRDPNGAPTWSDEWCDYLRVTTLEWSRKGTTQETCEEMSVKDPSGESRDNVHVETTRVSEMKTPFILFSGRESRNA